MLWRIFTAATNPPSPFSSLLLLSLFLMLLLLPLLLLLMMLLLYVKFKVWWGDKTVDKRNPHDGCSQGTHPIKCFPCFSSKRHSHPRAAIKGGSPGLVVMWGDSCSEGCEFEYQHHILDGHFSHIFVVVKIVMFIWKDANKLKWGRNWPIFIKTAAIILTLVNSKQLSVICRPLKCNRK